MLDRKKLEEWIENNERVLLQLKDEHGDGDSPFYAGGLSAIKKLKRELSSGFLDSHEN